ncbi:hypothetical protein C8R45DRAFT_830866 [Mycena sanguinolenta]|nr:hypothetical protein C8R45DRAFT_830866 [Mycena sanguinolenta]
MSSADTQNCSTCGKPAAMRCSHCRTKFYCSAEHQKSVSRRRSQDKNDNDTEAEIANARRGHQVHVTTFDALLLPWDSDTPRLVKIACEMYTTDLGKQHRLPDFTSYSGRNGFSESATISTMGHNGPALGYTLWHFWNGNFLQDGSPLNRSVVKLTKGKADHAWAGNLIALRIEEPTHLVSRYQDAKAEDLTVLATYFVDYGKRARQLYG